MPTSSRPWGTMTTMGQGKKMRRAACTPRAFKARSHAVERCRFRPLGLGATLCLQAGSGCLRARVTRARGVRGGRCQSPPGTAWGRPPPARHAPHRSWPRCGPLQRVQSAARPHSAHCRPRSGPVHDKRRGLPRSPARAPAHRALAGIGAGCGGECLRPRVGGTYRQGEVCKAPMEEGGAKMEQCNNKTNKVDEIHKTSYKIRTNVVRISREFPLIWE